jgi:hypothetical protein
MNDLLDRIIQQMILGCLKCYWHYCGDIVDDYIPRLLLLATSPMDMIRLYPQIVVRYGSGACQLYQWVVLPSLYFYRLITATCSREIASETC